MSGDLAPVGMEEIMAARARIAGVALVSPVVACAAVPAGKRVHLKLETVQPGGSFKIRPVANAVLSRPKNEVAQGLHAVSSGNSALAVALMARQIGVSATAHVPDNAPEAKLAKLRALGARISMQPLEAWWRAIEQGLAVKPGKGVLIDAVRDPACLAGDATIGAEILEQCPDVEAIFVPFGGGGLSCGIASAVRALKPDVKVIACELDTAHPAKSAFDAGHPVHRPFSTGFVSGIGFSTVLPEIWPLILQLIDDVITVSLREVAAAIEVMYEGNQVIAEGSGAVAVAAALSGRHSFSSVCAVVSGGNLDGELLSAILRGEVPGG
jgi:threonine dehydratase